MLSGLTWVAVAVVAAATLGGAVLASSMRRSHRLALQLAAAALVAVVAFDLAPDIARDVAETGSAKLAVGLGCGTAFAAAALVARWMCGCGAQPTTTTGLAIAAHRGLEGAAIALAGSAGVVIALVLHAAGEGFALQASGMDRRARSALVLACLSPAFGAAAFGGVSLPATVAPIVTALIAGALVAGAVRMLRTPRKSALADDYARPETSLVLSN